MTNAEREIVKVAETADSSETAGLRDRAPYHCGGRKFARDGYSVCLSYGTAIAMLTPKRKFVRVWGGYSKTSIGHLGDWCAIEGIPTVSGREWRALAVGRHYPSDSDVA